MPYVTPRCQALPVADHQVAFLVDGQERLRWHYGAQYPRPFFYPLIGPSGAALTRMGHPGDFSHEHHRSIWFAHQNVAGLDFWSEGKPQRIRQLEWLAYVDGDAEAVLAARLGWFDGHDALLVEQLLVAAMIPQGAETLVELQSTFTPNGKAITFGQTNFGFLAVRVAKSLSAHFGGGELTSSEGKRGEPAIFGEPARWMDYSGPVPVPGARAAGYRDRTEGITYFDHPTNPAYPARWHVRADGWMGASACRTAALEVPREKPLTLRYLLHAHAGDVDAAKADAVAKEFAGRAPWVVESVKAPHSRWQVRRGK